MGGQSNIEWTDASWTPIRARNLATGKVGWHCEHATTGCEFCYAEGMNKRLGTGLPFKPGHRNDIEIFLDEEMLLAPLRWKKPRMIFVCSMTDAFADFVKDEWLDKMFAVMALCPQHTFQVLTKRAERMRQYMTKPNPLDGFPQVDSRVDDMMRSMGYFKDFRWPLPNVWLGVSAERQQEADERIPPLLATPAAVLFLSIEPLLGPIFLELGWRKFNWIICGGESGPNARPMHPDWARSIRDQCEAPGVPFFFKQWGEWRQRDCVHLSRDHAVFNPDGSVDVGVGAGTAVECLRSHVVMERMGKKVAGRLLDGIEHNSFPVTDVSGAARTRASHDSKSEEATSA